MDNDCERVVLELVAGECVPDQFLHLPSNCFFQTSNYDPMQIRLYLGVVTYIILVGSCIECTSGNRMSKTLGRFSAVGFRGIYSGLFTTSVMYSNCERNISGQSYPLYMMHSITYSRC